MDILLDCVCFSCFKSLQIYEYNISLQWQKQVSWMMCDRRRKHWSFLNLCPKCLTSRQAPVQAHRVLESGLDKPQHWLQGMAKWWSRDLGQKGFGVWLFFQAAHCWAVWTMGQPSIGITHSCVDNSQISPLLFYLNQQDVQEHHLHLGNGIRGQLLLLFSTNIKHRSYTCTEKN